MKHFLENILICPVCENTDVTNFLSVLDHNSGHGLFKISECSGCGFRFTSPRPKEKNIMDSLRDNAQHSI